MKQTFGQYIKEKRTEKMMRVNAFAKAVGISTVYESYIENGKRPAPSEKVLVGIEKVLMLNSEEKSYMRYLASLSRSTYSVPAGVMKYLGERPYVCGVILTAKEKRLSEADWDEVNHIICGMKERTE